MAESKRERRGHFRGKPRPGRRVEVRYRVTERGETGEELRAFTKNIGVGGAFILTTDPAAPRAPLAARRPALMTLDLVLPNLDGFGVLERVRARQDLDDMPIMVISAVSDPGSIKRAYGYGVVDYVTKPFNVDLLDAKVKVFLR